MVKGGKMDHTKKNGSHLKNGSYLVKWVTLGIIGHAWKCKSNWKKWDTLGIMAHTCKNWSHLEKWVKLAKMGHIKEDVSYSERWVTQTKRVKLGKMDHT